MSDTNLLAVVRPRTTKEPDGPASGARGGSGTRLRLADTPREVHPLVACTGLTARMPHPRWKGPREPVQLKLPKHEKDVLAARASFAGLSYSEYVMALLRQELLDETGHPTWVRSAEDHGGSLQLAM